MAEPRQDKEKEMTKYNDGNWHGWNGGECPVHPDTIVEALSYDWNRPNFIELPAKDLGWHDDDRPIIAFRVVKEHREARELWVWEDMTGCFHAASYQMPGSFKVREVLE